MLKDQHMRYLETALQLLEVPERRRDDPEFLRASINLARSYLEPVYDALRDQEQKMLQGESCKEGVIWKEIRPKTDKSLFKDPPSPKEIARRYSQSVANLAAETKPEPIDYKHRLGPDMSRRFELVGVEQFKSMVYEGNINRDSGWGWPAVQGDNGVFFSQNRQIRAGDEIPEDADYILWRQS